MDFFDAKGVMVDTLRRLGIEPALEPADDPALIPGRSAAIVIDGQRAGTLGEIDPSVLGAFDMDGTTIALAEIEVSAVLSAMPLAEARYRPFSRYPESVRDLALVVDADVSAERIRGILAEHKLVKAAIARDVYTGKGVPNGKKSIAFGLVLQSDKGTLTSSQVTRVIDDLLRRLGRAVGAELRT